MPVPVDADVARADPHGHLDIPKAAQPLRLARIDAIGIGAIHLLALLAFVPWLFSWTGVVVAILGLYVFGTLGISLCFHRMLTHRGVVCPKWLEHSFAILGVCCVQDTPARWISIHRKHHEHADEQPDPHTPLVNFLWAHIGWMLFTNRELTRRALISRYAKDVLQDPFYARLEANFRWVRVILISWALFFAGGFVAELLLGGSLLEALQFGLSLLVWGAFVRTVLVWHITWSINSVTHLWGYRNYETDESSRNNLIVGFLSNGEGWHNNHHADPRSARYGHRWWELDVTWLTIRFLSAVGLATKVIKPSPHVQERYAKLAAATAHGGSASTPQRADRQTP
ncbi:acyl-CoA desaturase [Kaistia algarum]|uniref:acyl-CoA desaturase n=1 Tax=Kaistia algarum TaxID=2083279 RepID=UPI002250F6A4|nr:fatty acid desaturase [Kaistia algarum]MCX5514044.1 fatty acid desaturase [Kaistia algarum]